jgi:catechol 2,3-dioxygenase-like lactoylglutathione lyase family enzyme
MTFQAEHFGVAASDADTLKEWYLRVFEAKVLRKLNDTPPAWLLELAGGFWIEIYTAESKIAPQANRVAGWRHLALRVESIDAGREHLAAKGVAFEGAIKPAGGGGKVLFFSDPEGNLFHLIERPSGWRARDF